MVDQAPAEPVYSDKADPLFLAERAHIGHGTGPVFGLALSGGGIRSASFALGLLQALYGYGAFEKFHYLSTVSGGGYIGGALTYLRNAFTHFGPDWFPFGYLRGPGVSVKSMGVRIDAPADGDAGNDMARKIVAYLRQHASYMTPSRVFGRQALIAGVLRCLLSTLLPYMAILTGAFGLLIWAGFFDQAGPNYLFSLHAETVVEKAAAAAAETTGGATAETPQPQPQPQSCPDQICAALKACLAAPCAGEPESQVPSIFLAIWPGNVAIAIAALVAMAFVLSSFIAGIFHTIDRSEKSAESGYRALIWYYWFSGFLLLIALCLMALSTLPWVHGYLNALWAAGDRKLPANFTALFAAIGGAAALIGRLRGVLGGGEAKTSPLRMAGMALAGILFIYGLLLLAYGFSTDLLHAVSRNANGGGNFIWALAAFAAGLVAAVFININHATQHRIYRDRLMEVFCADEPALLSGEWAPAKRAQSPAGWLVRMVERRRPYHLINTCLVTTDSNKRRYRGRGGDNFILSPLFSGSDATGWVATAKAMGTLSIATAVAVSGAALNAQSGPHGTGILRNKAYAAALSLLGLNLGYWTRNPKQYKGGAEPHYHMPTLLKPGLAALTGRNLNEEGKYVQLSDGGHFENLAIYELIRRKVSFLWVSDAGQDSGFSFEDLANAIERVRVDFGVNIRFREEQYDLTHLIPGSAETDSIATKNFAETYNLAKRGYAIGAIEYPDAPHGVIVYVKSTLTRGLPGDLYGYKARNSDFPHQTTLDQFFDEDQFEAYRELGYRLTAQLFLDIEQVAKIGSRLPPPLARVADLVEFRPGA